MLWLKSSKEEASIRIAPGVVPTEWQACSNTLTRRFSSLCLHIAHWRICSGRIDECVRVLVQLAVLLEQAARFSVVFIEQDAEELLAGGQCLGGDCAPRRRQIAQQVVTPGGTKQRVHFLQHFGQLCMQPLSPVLRINEAYGPGEELRTYGNDQVVLTVTRLK